MTKGVIGSYQQLGYCRSLLGLQSLTPVTRPDKVANLGSKTFPWHEKSGKSISRNEK